LNRKFVALLLTFILLISTIASVNASNSYEYVVTTNKSSYQVGDTVYILVSVTNNSTPYIGTPVTIKVSNATNSSIIFADQQVTNNQGTSVSVFRLDSTIALGTYIVTTNTVGSQKTTSFQITASSGIFPVTPSGNTPTPNQGDSGNVIAATPVLNSTTGIATTAVPEGVLTNAVSNAVNNSNGQKDINVEIPVVPGANGYSIALPSSLLNSTGTANTLVHITTGTATIVVPNNMLAAELSKDKNTVELVITRFDGNTLPTNTKTKIGNHTIVDVSLLMNGKTVGWSNSNSSVQISIPYSPTQTETDNLDNLVIYYIDDNGNTYPVSNSRYDAKQGNIVFHTNHFSKYAIAYVSDTIEEINNLPWAEKQINAMVIRDIIKLKPENKFDPQADITRGDFIYGLVNTLNLSASFDTNFLDVNTSDYYYKELGIAKKLGIANGVEENKFNPNGTISRQEMMTLIARALKLTNKLSNKTADLTKLNKFNDQSIIASYAKDSIALVIADGIIEGDGNNIAPLSKTTRAQAAVVLYRILNK